MKYLWYHLIKSYIRFVFIFLFKKIKVEGKENIPKKGTILFLGNHQNGLLDPLLVACTNGRNTNYLTRASAFKSNIVASILKSLNMIPIYRMRDGLATINKNHAVFELCYQLLHQKKALLMFPEGNHSLKRTVRQLSKGFTRIILGTLDKFPDTEIVIIPVGFNYNAPADYLGSVNIIYGNPINASDYFDKNDNFKTINNLKKVVSDALKELTVHIPDDENYEATINHLLATNTDFLNPKAINKQIETIQDTQPKTAKIKQGIFWSFIYYITYINGFIAIKIWHYFKAKIVDTAFISTFRFAVMATVFPLIFMLQSFIVSTFFGSRIGWIYLGISLLLGYLVKVTKPIAIRQ